MKPTREARELLAKQIDAKGPCWANLANSVRAGFTNLWLDLALAAIDQALDQDREGE